MDGQTRHEPVAQRRTEVSRRSDRELVVTRRFDAPRHLVFRAWAEAELFRQWWVPKDSGITLVACDMDVRTGGTYRLAFRAEGAHAMEFHGTYLEVVPDERIVWTNEEGDDGAVTTVIVVDQDGKTLLTFSELYPSKEALDDAMQGPAAGLPTQLDQLDEFLAEIGN